MKKIISLFILLFVIISSFSACSKPEGYVNADVDYNFSGCTENALYTTVIAISENYSDYNGKTVAISGKFSYLYDFKESKCVESIIIATDPTNCCDAYLTIDFAEGISAVPGAFSTFIGRFVDGKRMLVTEVVSTAGTASVYDVDARSLSAADLKTLIDNYGKNHKTSDLNGKKVLLFGHHVVKLIEASGIRYKYLAGYDGNGKTTWSIELDKLADGVTLPIQNGNYLNPCVVTGTLSFYTEGSTTYASIDVDTIARVYPK